MSELREALCCCMYSFRSWRGSARVVITFSLSFILCFLVTERTVSFAREHNTYVQILEPFIWSFGDSRNILLASLLLLLLFSDMPFVTAGTPFFLVRTTRRAWVAGQALYVLGGTGLYVLFVFAATCVLCTPFAFAGDQWSEAAALLGYSGLGTRVGIPADTTIMEMSRPVEAACIICILLLLYMLVLGLLMLAANLWKGRRAAFGAAAAFSLWGLLLEPALFMRILRLPEGMQYRANVLSVWFSPLNQAAYPMHSFGYNELPTVPQSMLMFSAVSIALFWAGLRAVRHFQFQFAGTDQ